MSVREPYAPDVDPDTDPPSELDDLADVVVEGADWSNARAVRTTLTRVELRACRLTGVELAEAKLLDVVFADCRLDLAALRFAQLERVAFRDCRLEEADLHGATLRDVAFERCELREATITGVKVERVRIEGGDLTGLHGAEALRGVTMSWDDVVANGPLFAAALGIDIAD